MAEVLRPTLVGEPPFWESVSVFEYHIRVVGGLLGAFEAVWKSNRNGGVTSMAWGVKI